MKTYGRTDCGYMGAGEPERIGICRKVETAAMVERQRAAGYLVRVEPVDGERNRILCHPQPHLHYATLAELLDVEPLLIKPCAGRLCCHYGEGCALGYPLYRPLNGFGGGVFPPPQGEKLDELRMLYSREFKIYWEGVLQRPAGEDFLPCHHEGCGFSNCQLLQGTQFMSLWMKRQTTQNTAPG